MLIFSKLSNLQIKDIIFTGGEPLLRSDLFEILGTAKEYGYDIDLCTNGTLITDSVAKELKKYLSEISVSLDAHTDKLNDEIRGKNHGFKQTIEGIKNLVRCGHKVHLITVVTRNNYFYISNIVNLAESLGAHSITFLGLVVEYARDQQYTSGIELDNNERLIVQENILNLRSKNQNLIVNSKRILPIKVSEKCGAGKNILGITADGNLLPCILLKDDVICNLLDNNQESLDNSLFSKISSNLCFKR